MTTLDILRVDTVVYSVEVDETGDPLNVHAICDHCGAILGEQIGYRWTPASSSQPDDEVWIDPSSLTPHACPPFGGPLPPHSVCGRRPCARCQEPA